MDAREHYTRTWELVLTHLAGWSESQIREWIARWEPELRRADSMMYHESPLYYVAGCLIPSDLSPQTCNFSPLVSKVMRAIGDPPMGAVYDWDAAKARVRATIDQEPRH